MLKFNHHTFFTKYTKGAKSMTLTSKKENLIIIIISLLLFLFQMKNIIYSTETYPSSFLSSINNSYTNNFISTGFIIILTVLIVEYCCEFSNSRNYKPFKRTLLYVLSLLLLDLIYCIIISGYIIFAGYKINLNINEILYYLKPILLSNISVLVLFNSAGLIITQFITNTKSNSKLYVFSIFVFPLSLYLIQKQFQSTYNSILPGIKLNNYFYSNIQFIFLLAITLFILFICISLIRSKSKLIFLMLIPFLLFISLNYRSYQDCKDWSAPKISDYYENCNKDMVTEPLMIRNINLSNNYNVSEYSMDINLQENFHNKCEMKVTRNNIFTKELKFNFYYKNNIEKLTINNIDAKFHSDLSNIYIEIPNEITNNELTVFIEYSSYIYTNDILQNSDFITNDVGYLSHIFSWYPRVNNEVKKFNLKINGCNKDLISNLNVTRENDSYILTGDKSDFYLYYDDISEIQYNNYKIIGSKYLINDINLIKYLYNDFEIKKTSKEHTDFQDIDTIILVPTSISGYFYPNKNTILYPISY